MRGNWTTLQCNLRRHQCSSSRRVPGFRYVQLPNGDPADPMMFNTTVPEWSEGERNAAEVLPKRGRGSPHEAAPTINHGCVHNRAPSVPPPCPLGGARRFG